MEREVDGVLAYVPPFYSRSRQLTVYDVGSEKEKEGADAEAEFAQADRDLHAAENKKSSLQQKLDTDKARLKGLSLSVRTRTRAYGEAVVQQRVTDALLYESEDGRHFESIADCIEDAQRALSSIEA